MTAWKAGTKDVNWLSLFTLSAANVTKTKFGLGVEEGMCKAEADGGCTIIDYIPS